MMEYKVTLLSSLYKGHAATFIAFKDVQNPLELKNEILKGNIKAAVFNKNMISGLTSLQVIADRALHLDKIDKKVTKNIHSEAIYSLSPSKNITDCFKTFGMTEDCTAIVLVHNHLLNDIEEISHILKQIDGQPADIRAMEDTCDSQKLIKLYKITEQELKLNTLEEAIITRICNKDV